MARDACADDLGGRALRLRVAAGRRGRSREPLRSGDRAARAGRHRRHAARRLRARSQQHRAARRASPGPWTPTRRTDRSAAATASTTTRVQLATSEGLFFNPPYFNLSVFFPGAGPPPSRSPIRSRRLPAVHSAVGDRVPARPADAVDGALERRTCSARSAQSRAIEVAYVGSRGHDLISARDVQPGAPRAPIRSTCGRTRSSPTSRSSSRARRRATTRCRCAISSGRPHGMSVLVGLHARQVDRRRVGLLHERGRSELPAEQPRPRRRARPLVVRHPAPVHGGAIAARCRSGRGSRCWPIRGG